MAFRGRGRGRGRGFGFDLRHGNHAPFVLFPEDVNLPPVPTLTKEDKLLVRKKYLLESFFKDSCYHLVEDVRISGKPDKEIERYSDRFKQDALKRREDFASYLKLTPSNFPAELIQGTKRPRPNQKRLRWDQDSEDKKLDLFEKLENSEKSKGDNAKKKQDESDNEDGDEAEEANEEDSDQGDYDQNIDFDDDEEDLNLEEEETEDVYE